MPFPPGVTIGHRSRPVTPVTSVLPMPVQLPTGDVAPLAPAAPVAPASGLFTRPAVPTMKPVAAVLPAASRPSVLNGMGQKVGTAVANTGKAIAANPGTALSVLQGVGGALSFATAKDPGAMPAPKPYTPPIRGAQGMESTGYNQARADILGSQTTASTADSSDVAAGVVQRLLGQRQTNAALTGLASTNNQAYQQDRTRVADQETQAYGTNYQQQAQYAQAKYADDRRLYEGRRTQSAAQVQGAVDNIAAGYQAKKQAQQLKLEGSNRRAEAEITQLHTSLASATTPQERELYLKRLAELDPEGIRAKGAQVRYGTPKLAGGGMLPTGEVKFSTAKAGKSSSRAGLRSRRAPVPASVAAVHDLSKEFGRHLDRFSTQARAAFDRSIATASRLRSSAPNTLAGLGRK